MCIKKVQIKRIQAVNDIYGESQENILHFTGSVRLIEIFSNVLKKSQRETTTEVDANYVESHTSQKKYVALSHAQ